VHVPVLPSRPDIVAEVARLRAARGDGVLAVYASGPKRMNDAVYNAVYRSAWGAGVQFKQLAHDL